MFKSLLAWATKNLSNDTASSNSRVLQTAIVINVLVILWVVLAKANWIISDNARLITLTLITAGAGNYIANKIAGGSNG